LSSELNESREMYSSLQREHERVCLLSQRSDEMLLKSNDLQMQLIHFFHEERAAQLEAEATKEQLQQQQPPSILIQRLTSNPAMLTKHALIAVLDAVGELLRPCVTNFFIALHHEISKKADVSWPHEVERLRRGKACLAPTTLDIEKLSGSGGAWALAMAVGLHESHASKMHKYDGFQSLDIFGITQLMLSCNGLVPPKFIGCVHQLRKLRNHVCHKASHHKLPCRVHEIRSFIHPLCSNVSGRVEDNAALLRDALALLREIERPEQRQHAEQHLLLQEATRQ
jgi:hypothetical protein